jgi:Gly-Xaa carboxypeptidase
MMVELEAHPIPAKLHRATAVYGTAQCYAEHGKELPKGLRRALKRSVHSDRNLKKAEEILFKEKEFKGLTGTTQAIDLIQGGVKANALPEEAWAVVNHRIATDRYFDAEYLSLIGALFS